METALTYTEQRQCPHCNHRAKMIQRAIYSEVALYCPDESIHQMGWDEGEVYEICSCASCEKIFVTSTYFDERHLDETNRPEVLYPQLNEKLPRGLPAQIQTEYEAALLVRKASANAYGVLLGRTLEMVCIEQGVQKGSLEASFKELAKQNKIPDNLLQVALKLNHFRHAGAHATVGNLGGSEVPILDDLCAAVLEYVYTAPWLVKRAETRLKSLRETKKTNSEKAQP